MFVSDIDEDGIINMGPFYYRTGIPEETVSYHNLVTMPDSYMFELMAITFLMGKEEETRRIIRACDADSVEELEDA